MITLFGVFLLTLLLITTVGIVRTENLFAAVMLMGIFSLQLAAIFFVLDAADVALTEAAVGAGIATVLLLGALAMLGETERRAKRSRRLAGLVVAATTLPILFATLGNPRLGDPAAPVHQHVAPWYLEETPRLIDTSNVVTAILASFRGYDTFGEVFVIFTAGIGVLFILANGGDTGGRSNVASSDVQGVRHYLVPRAVGRLLMPFLVLFGLYIQFHGDFGPGGGFQAGALISAGLILYALAEGQQAALRVVPQRVLTGMTAAGALLFGGVGVVCMLRGGNFLDYSALAADPIAGQHLGILLVEIGVGLTVTGVLLTIFHAFAGREPRR